MIGQPAPMRGQRLYIRPVIPDDEATIDAFFRQEAGVTIPMCSDMSGLVARIVGDVAAIAVVRVWGRDTLEIVGLVVASRLRDLQIGRRMIDAVDDLARNDGRSRIIVDGTCSEAGFFLHLGFEREGGRLVRNVVETG